MTKFNNLYNEGVETLDVVVESRADFFEKDLLGVTEDGRSDDVVDELFLLSLFEVAPRGVPLYTLKFQTFYFCLLQYSGSQNCCCLT